MDFRDQINRRMRADVGGTREPARKRRAAPGLDTVALVIVSNRAARHADPTVGNHSASNGRHRARFQHGVVVQQKNSVKASILDSQPAQAHVVATGETQIVARVDQA